MRRKRYIAGATCPSCSALDKLYVVKDGGEDLLKCNACGYKEYRNKRSREWQPIQLPDSDESSD